MDPNTIRKLDVSFGKFICGALTLWDALIRLGRARKPFTTKKIAFIKLIEQGATVLAYTALRNAVKMVGKENVYFLVFNNNKDIIYILDVIPRENIIIIRQNSLASFIFDSIRCLFIMRKLKIDTTIDMEFFTRAPIIISYMSGAKVRVGLDRFNSEGPYRGDLLTHKVAYNPYLHVSTSYALLVECLKLEPGDTPLPKVDRESIEIENFTFKPSNEELKKAFEILEMSEAERKGKQLILLNPNASDLLPIRKWDVENFIVLAKKILESFKDAEIYITGSPSEKENALRIMQIIDSPRIKSIAGKTTLRELIAVYTICDILVTNDSGPGLFASMTDITSIIMFGPETPALFGARTGNARIIYKNLACSPCVNVFNHRFSPCHNNLCMQTITVDEVFSEINLIMLDLISGRGKISV